ncbi:MAG: thioredoxin family protein [bacterium]|nr:thioredoxin family protein [bacterium]
MNKFKRILGLGITLGLGALALAGCQGKDKKNNDENKDNGTVVVTPTDETPTVEAKVYEKGLSQKAYNFEKEFFFDDYNKRSLADTNRQGVATFSDKDIIFDAITYEELVNILESDGKYLFFFGGSWCHNTRAAAPYVNSIAKEYGVDKIFNFDFFLDGTTNSTHVRNTNPTDPARVTAGTEYNFLYGELVTKYLTNLNDFVEYKTDTASALKFNDKEGTETTVAKLQVPFLFYYDKSNASGPIVSAFEEMVDLDSKGIYKGKNAEGGRNYITNDYVDGLHGFFDSIKKTYGTVEVTDYSDKDYIINTYNTRSGKEIFASDSQINIETITYRQLEWLLNQEGNSIILLGGTWCGNTQASIKTFNDFAVKNNLTIYNFDTKLDSGIAKSKYGYSKDAHIRESNTKLTTLYANLIDKYFTNITTLYNVNDEASYKHIEYADKDGNVVKVKKLQVPYLLNYNKDAKDSDNLAAPITAYYEEMLTLVDTRADYVYSETNYKSIKDNTLNVFKAYATRTGVEAKAID